MFKPHNLQQAIGLAKLQERAVENAQKKGKAVQRDPNSLPLLLVSTKYSCEVRFMSFPPPYFFTADPYDLLHFFPTQQLPSSNTLLLIFKTAT